MIACLMRSLHTKYDRPALIHDLWADRLVRPDERERLAETVLRLTPADACDQLPSNGSVEAILHAVWFTNSVYGGVIVRTRYNLERLEAAVRQGIRQYVILGTGLDAFGADPPGFARDMDVFEVDHPASQVLKRARLAESGVPLPPTLHFVPADLGAEGLASALARSSFRFDRPALFSWLGVTVYLTREANLATLRGIARLAAPGSELVFTYLEQSALESPAMRRMRAAVAAFGEPWRSGFDPAELPDLLRVVGLNGLEDLGGDELYRRYCQRRADGLTPGRSGHIVWARVEAGAA